MSDERLSAASLSASAQHLAEVGRHEQAIPLLTAALTRDPDDPDLRCDLAVALMNAGRMEDADREAKQAIAVAPEYDRVYRLGSLVARHLGRMEEGVTLAREAVRLAPATPAALRSLAAACIDGRLWLEGLEVALTVVQLAPDDSHAHELVAHASACLGDWAGAEQACRHALRLDPTSWSAMHILGLALKMQGRRAEAAQAYDQAAQLNPDDADLRASLVQVMRPRSHAIAWLDMTAAALAPISAPYLVIRWGMRWWLARRTRSQLSPAAREYYESQTLRARVRRMGPRDFGFVCGLISLVPWFVLANLAAAGLERWEPQWGGLDVALPSLAMFALAACAGLLGGWLRWRRRRA